MPKASPRVSANANTQGHYKVGRPYRVKGRWFYPKEDYSYDETGIASWYGDAFHNRLTANGEKYNKNELTAAHKTLPLPSLARITNLENGRSIVVRINDRGPFSGARIIDLSERSAELLNFKRQGIAKVRVQVLADESKAIADAMRRYGGPTEPVARSYAENVGEPEVIAQAPLIKEETVDVAPLAPVYTTAEAPNTLQNTKPVPYVVQLPVTERTRLFIQAGAFTVPENAYRLKQTLADLGAVSVTTAVVHGRTFYRVRLGPIDTIPKADTLLAQVKKAGVEGARTIVD